jgi:8-oxo-dGTP pyrophosphatase MutT (NUDIX family)
MKDEGKEVELKNLQYSGAVTYVKRYSLKHVFRAGAIIWAKHLGRDYYLVFRSLSRPNRGVQVPGGRIERYENIAQTVVREILEETGVDTKILCPLGFAYFEDLYRKTSNHQIYYIVRPVGKIDVTKRWFFTDKDKTKQQLECWWVPVEGDTSFLSVGHDKIVEMFRDWLVEHLPHKPRNEEGEILDDEYFANNNLENSY